MKQENSEIDKKEIQRQKIQRAKEKAQSVINEKKKKEKSFQIPKEKNFTLYLCDLDKDLCVNLAEYFQQFENVAVIHSKFENLTKYDCMVSAANSFGLMDGGVDLAIINFFGTQLQSKVQKYIIENYDGEQPIGTSFIMKTDHKDHPYLAHTPTMRVPYSIQKTDYVYLAMKAMLKAVADHNKIHNDIHSVVCTGLGTYYGKMDYEEAARLMSTAYYNFLYPPKEITWEYARFRQNLIGWGGSVENYGYSIVEKENSNGMTTKEINEHLSNLKK
jgi:O-acetyl-ADP-ribose deacetylase (regulator of RNase III)